MQHKKKKKNKLIYRRSYQSENSLLPHAARLAGNECGVQNSHTIMDTNSSSNFNTSETDEFEISNLSSEGISFNDGITKKYKQKFFLSKKNNNVMSYIIFLIDDNFLKSHKISKKIIKLNKRTI